jgi:DNA-binding CsgD family transcriptional regulator
MESVSSNLRVDGVRRCLEELRAAIEVFAEPAFLVTREGDVLLRSPAARTFAAPELECIQRSLGRAIAGRTANAPAANDPTPTWDLRPVAAGGELLAFLAVLRAPPRDDADDGALATARRRWKLTARQAEVLALVTRGLTNALVAETLAISARTVEFHLATLFDKAGVSNRATLIIRVLELE